MAILHPLEYVISLVTLLFSMGIGVYFAWRSKRVNSVKNYYIGGGKLNMFAVAMSMSATSWSPQGIIGVSAESYLIGNALIWSAISPPLFFLPCIIYFIPVFRRLPINSIYQYLEMRFNSELRRISSLVMTLGGIFYMGGITYAASATMDVITPISLVWSIIVLTGVCLIYTLMGGMKAVVWTDVFQAALIAIGLIALIISATLWIGGFDAVFDSLERGQRYTAFRFDYGLISRVSPLAIILQRASHLMGERTFCQQYFQRFKSCKSTSQARWSMMINAVSTSVFVFMIIFVGLLAFPMFETCDPVSSGKIAAIDELAPYMAMSRFTGIPGIVGLFLAAVLGSVLSSVSSALNSYSILIVEDFLCVWWKNLNKNEKLKVFVVKIVVGIMGILVIALSCLISLSRSNIMQLMLSISGVFTGPISGIFYLGFFFPRASSKGATLGLILGCALGMFLFVGNEFFKIQYTDTMPPRFLSGCALDNSTTSTLNEFLQASLNRTTEHERTPLQNLFNLNFYLFTPITMVFTILAGYILSLVIGPNDPTTFDARLFIPLIDNKRLPGKVRKLFRFGVPELTPEKKEIEEIPRFEGDEL